MDEEAKIQACVFLSMMGVLAVIAIIVNIIF